MDVSVAEAAGADPAPPPPPPPPADSAAPSPNPGRVLVRGARHGALASTETAGGLISFYRSGKFQAVCTNAFHGQCILTRGNTKRAAWKGRPLASMVLWLDLGRACATKQQHWDSLLEVENSLDRRRAIRGLIMGDPLFADVLGYERQDLEAGEEEEPQV